MAEKVSIINGRIVRFRETGKVGVVNGRIVKNQDAPIGGGGFQVAWAMSSTLTQGIPGVTNA